MSTREDNRHKMEQRLYDAAIDLFCELGYKKTTLIDIAFEAEVSTRTLYRYFPTKESILRKFCKENILSLKSFAGGLSADLSLKDKVLGTMVQDFKLMFCLFDVSYILHSARDETGMLNRFELENIMSSESIYCNLFAQEQLRVGMRPDDSVALCASVVMGIYRHCNDVYRFKKRGSFEEGELREFYRSHLEAIWDSLVSTLLSTQAGVISRGRLDRHLFSAAEC